jgi:hypothetical protein
VAAPTVAPRQPTVTQAPVRMTGQSNGGATGWKDYYVQSPYPGNRIPTRDEFAAPTPFQKAKLTGIERGKAKLESQGMYQNPPEESPSFLWATLGKFGALGNTTAAIAKAAFEGKPVLPEAKRAFLATWHGLPYSQQVFWKDALMASGLFQDRPGKVDLVDIGGLVGDIFLDPLTYLTFGTTGEAKVGAKGLELAGKLAHSAEELGRMGKFAEAGRLLPTKAMQAAAGQRSLISAFGVPIVKGTAVYQKLEPIMQAARSLPGVDLIGKTFARTPAMWEAGKELGHGDMQFYKEAELAKRYGQLHGENVLARATGEAIKGTDKPLQDAIAFYIEHPEGIGAFKQRIAALPEHVSPIIKERVAKAATAWEANAPKMEELAAPFRKQYADYVPRLEEQGVNINEWTDYIHHIYDRATPQETGMVRGFLKKAGIVRDAGDMALSGGNRIGTGTPSFAKKRTLKTMMDAIEYGLSPKMNVADQMLAYGKEAEKVIHTRKFVNEILDNFGEKVAIPKDVGLLKIADEGGRKMDLFVPRASVRVPEGTGHLIKVDDVLLNKIDVGNEAARLERKRIWQGANQVKRDITKRFDIEASKKITQLFKDRATSFTAKDMNAITDLSFEVWKRRALKDNRLAGLLPEIQNIRVQFGKDIARITGSGVPIAKGKTIIRELRSNLNNVLDALEKVKGEQLGKVVGYGETLAPEFAYKMPAVMADLTNKYLKAVSSDAELNVFTKLNTKFLNVFKPWMLSWPGTQFRNMQGGIWNNFIDGIRNPLDYMRASKELMAEGWKYARGKPVSKWFADAMENGVLDRGQFNMESLRSAESLMKKGMTPFYKDPRSLNPLSSEFAVLRVGRGMMNPVENVLRYTAYKHYLKKGFNPRAAGLRVMASQFDYSPEVLSKFDKSMTQIVPFWRWTRNNIPYQLGKALERPGQYAVGEKILSGLERSANETPQEQEYRRPYMRDLGMVPIPNTEVARGIMGAVGKTVGRLVGMPVTEPTHQGTMYLNPNLPFQDLQKLTPRQYSDLLRETSPIVKMVFNVVLGEQAGFRQDLATGRRLSESELDTAPGWLQAIANLGQRVPGISAMTSRLGMVQHRADGRWLIPPDNMQNLLALMPPMTMVGGFTPPGEIQAANFKEKNRAYDLWMSNMVSKLFGIKFVLPSIEGEKNRRLIIENERLSNAIKERMNQGYTFDKFKRKESPESYKRRAGGTL